MTDQKIIPLGESDTEDFPSLARRTAGHLRTGLTGHAATALRTGSGILVRRGWHLLPDDGTLARLGYVGLGGYVTAYGAAHAGPAAPFVVPAAALAWCVAAWTVAPPAEPSEELADETDTEAQLEAPPGSAQEVFAHWLLDTIGARSGIHLADLYPAMRQLAGNEARTDPELRAALRALRVPVDRTLRVGRVAGRTGVSRTAVEALLNPLSPEAESAPAIALESGPDLRKSPDGEQHSTPVESA